MEKDHSMLQQGRGGRGQSATSVRSLRRPRGRVDFLEDRWADHATYWQLAVWFRQVSLTLIVNLPDIAIAVAIADAEASTLSRPIVWVHAGLAVVLLAGCWRWHHRTHPYEYRFQNQLESWLYFSAIAVVIMAVALGGEG